MFDFIRHCVPESDSIACETAKFLRNGSALTEARSLCASDEHHQEGDEAGEWER